MKTVCKPGYKICTEHVELNREIEVIFPEYLDCPFCKLQRNYDEISTCQVRGCRRETEIHLCVGHGGED